MTDSTRNKEELLQICDGVIQDYKPMEFNDDERPYETATVLKSLLTEREGWVQVPKGVIERLRIWKDKWPKGTVFSHGRMKEGEWEKTVLELSSFTVGELDEIIDILIAAAPKQEEPKQ